MNATATVVTLPVLLDTRPARGKHRTRRSAADLADRVLATWRRARVEVAVSAATAGAVLASVIA